MAYEEEALPHACLIYADGGVTDEGVYRFATAALMAAFRDGVAVGASLSGASYVTLCRADLVWLDPYDARDAKYRKAIEEYLGE